MTRNAAPPGPDIAAPATMPPATAPVPAATQADPASSAPAPGRRKSAQSAASTPDLRLVSAFLDAQAAEAGAARNTLLAYGRDLADFAAFTAHRGLTLTTVAREDIESYLARCEAEGLSRAKIGRAHV